MASGCVYKVEFALSCTHASPLRPQQEVWQGAGGRRGLPRGVWCGRVDHPRPGRRWAHDSRHVDEEHPSHRQEARSQGEAGKCDGGQECLLVAGAESRWCVISA